MMKMRKSGLFSSRAAQVFFWKKIKNLLSLNREMSSICPRTEAQSPLDECGRKTIWLALHYK